MATEKFANKPATTLNGGIDGVVTSLTVTDASAFPSTGQFRIIIDAEYMLVTAVSGNNFTVQRGAESSTAFPHSNGASVEHILTAGAVNLLVQTDDSRLSDNRTASGIKTATTVVAVSSATAPTAGQVLTATSGTAADWETPAPGSTLVTLAVDISLTTSANTAIDTRPATPTGINRWKLISIDLRLKVAVTGGGTPSASVTIGSTSGGNQIVTAQTINTSTAVGSIVGGFALNSLGSDMSQTTGFESFYPASQSIYANVTATGSPSTGTLTAYLLWQGLP